jgi:hypothetical protein
MTFVAISRGAPMLRSKSHPFVRLDRRGGCGFPAFVNADIAQYLVTIASRNIIGASGCKLCVERQSMATQTAPVIARSMTCTSVYYTARPNSRSKTAKNGIRRMSAVAEPWREGRPENYGAKPQAAAAACGRTSDQAPRCRPAANSAVRSDAEPPHRTRRSVCANSMPAPEQQRRGWR